MRWEDNLYDIPCEHCKISGHLEESPQAYIPRRYSCYNCNKIVEHKYINAYRNKMKLGG